MSRKRAFAGGIVRSWFELTTREQRALLLILALFLLGIFLKWTRRNGNAAGDPTAVPPAIAAESGLDPSP